MKRPIATIFLLSTAAALSACGIRGELERPPPIFSAAPADAAERTPVAVTVEADAAAPKDADSPYYNDLGGEIPKADPVGDVNEGGLDEVEPG
ncbi:LPS translocon maturation chaperone LptM [Henriciella litoralis]|uniref:LPS translocon maturation chaperone LptM n=1 Tax=Henriciella litoralis TaxID=568102 RepID=UPI000A001ECB|nr:lipoprotein [Henriciella litoralis]